MVGSFGDLCFVWAGGGSVWGGFFLVVFFLFFLLFLCFFVGVLFIFGVVLVVCGFCCGWVFGWWGFFFCGGMFCLLFVLVWVG